MEPHEYLRHTLDPVRLAILGAAAVAVPDPSAIAEALGVRRTKVLTQIARLEEAGLLVEGRLDPALLRDIGARLPEVAIDEQIIGGAWSSEEARVLATFFEGPRLTRIPATRSKRLLVLERLVQEFDAGVRYPEKQVSFMLQMFHPDYAALRRHLVDEGFLTRADGVYWRTGGRYDLDD